MTNKKIKVIINGEIIELEKNLSIKEMLKILNIKPNNIAVECNLQIVSKSQYSSYKIQNNNKIEIVNFIGGG